MRRRRTNKEGETQGEEKEEKETKEGAKEKHCSFLRCKRTLRDTFPSQNLFCPPAYRMSMQARKTQTSRYRKNRCRTTKCRISIPKKTHRYSTKKISIVSDTKKETHAISMLKRDAPCMQPINRPLLCYTSNFSTFNTIQFK